MKRPPRLYFSFRSPFSWMALRQLEAAVPDAPERFEYVPFWDPDAQTSAALAERGAEFHYTQMSKAKHFYILYDTKRLAARHGYRMTWPVDVDPWWEVPHLGWLMARRLGTERRFYAAVTEARWEQGLNVCEPEVLRAVCSAAGLDADALVAAVDDPEIRAEGADALTRAYHDDVFGIPYFKVGRERFWGLDRLDAVVAELHRTQAAAALSVPAPAGASVPVPAAAPPSASLPAADYGAEPVPALAYDSDTAGGCG